MQRLQIRQYGVMGTAQVRAQYMHSKAVIGSELGMIGSYNYTYASRFRHAEDGFVFDESSQLDCHRERLRLAWENGTVVTIDKPSATTRKAGPVLFGGQGEPAKGAEDIERATEDMNFPSRHVYHIFKFYARIEAGSFVPKLS